MATAKLILKNGNLLTMSEPEHASAIAVDEGGRILAVGSDSEVLNIAAPDTLIYDLNGRTLIPGFFDCHVHILWLGMNLGHVDIAPPKGKTKEDILRLLIARREEQPSLTCIQGSGYDQNVLPGARHLTRYDLDEVSTHLPVRINHASGHAAVVNSKALEMLEFTRDTPNPDGGEIVRDENGKPTGVLLETASWSLLERILPETTPHEAVEALGRASRYLLERGITSASDANTPPNAIEWYEEAVATNALQVRVNSMVGWAEVLKQIGESGIPRPRDLQPNRYGLDGHRYHVGQAKLFADGAITTRTCWLNAPFSDSTNNYGIPLHDPYELLAYIIKAHNAGWQIATHAIGDRAVDVVLSSYAEAQRQNSRTLPAHRIEHCMLLDTNLITRLRRQNVWSIGQPEFIARLGDAYELALGEERANRLSPYATLEKANVAQAFSSDNPVVPGAPLAGIYAAMQRETPSGRVLNAKERVSAEVGLYAYTTAPAYATRTYQDRGALEMGKLADFTLLSADPTTTPASEWERVQVVATFVNGECLYGAERL